MNKFNILKYVLIIVPLVYMTPLVSKIVYISFPYSSPKPVTKNIRAQYSPLQEQYIKSTLFTSDYKKLNTVFESQIYRTYCGVASSVIVLKAMGVSVAQNSFFSNKGVDKVKGFKDVFFGGMSLAELSGLLEAYGVFTKVYYASDMNVDDFRRIIKRNLSSSEDFLLINYLRSVLGQEKVGHISPIGAYDQEKDEVLVMDVTAYHYPHVWVKTNDLFNAMNTIDSQHSRGLIEVN